MMATHDFHFKGGVSKSVQNCFARTSYWSTYSRKYKMWTNCICPVARYLIMLFGNQNQNMA